MHALYAALQLLPQACCHMLRVSHLLLSICQASNTHNAHITSHTSTHLPAALPVNSSATAVTSLGRVLTAVAGHCLQRAAAAAVQAVALAAPAAATPEQAADPAGLARGVPLSGGCVHGGGCGVCGALRHEGRVHACCAWLSHGAAAAMKKGWRV